MRAKGDAELIQRGLEPSDVAVDHVEVDDEAGRVEHATGEVHADRVPDYR
jgi:hypothetical protein